MFPALDQILAGKYRLIRQLGQGGMGSVWLAEHLALRSPVAIKLIEPSIATNPEALARFLREAQAAAALRSPHVVQILDYGVDAGVPFIAMEVLEGESLAARLARLGRLAPADILKVMTHVARAVGRAHEAGVVHRDLKPDNIYIVRNDEEELAKVLDFGVAKSNLHGLGATGSSATRTGSVLGTPYYMSPEQAEGSKVVDHRSDVWALGVIVWECFLGNRPFEAESLGGLVLAICARELPVPSRVGPVPFGFDGWFARACARDPAQRFGSAKEAINELRRVCGDPTLGVQPSATPAPQAQHGGYPDHLRTAAPALGGTTSNLGVVSTRSAGIPSTKLSGALVAAVMIGFLALATGGTLLLLRARSGPAAAESSVAAPLPPAESVGVARAPDAPTPSLAPSAAAPDSVATTADTSSAAKPVVPSASASAQPAVAARPPASTAAHPAAAPAARPAAASPAPPAAPRPAAPAARPGVNLGI